MNRPAGGAVVRDESTEGILARFTVSREGPAVLPDFPARWVTFYVIAGDASFRGVETLISRRLLDACEDVVAGALAPSYTIFPLWEAFGSTLSFVFADADRRPQQRLVDHMKAFLFRLQEDGSIKEFTCGLRNFDRYAKSHGGPAGLRAVEAFTASSSRAVWAYLRVHGSFQDNPGKRAFSLALVHAMLELLAADDARRIEFLRAGLRIHAKLLATESGVRMVRKDVEKIYSSMKERLFVPGAKTGSPVRLDPAKGNAERDILRRLKTSLKAEAEKFVRARVEVERYFDFEDVVWRRFLHYVFMPLFINDVEEYALMHCLLRRLEDRSSKRTKGG